MAWAEFSVANELGEPRLHDTGIPRLYTVSVSYIYANFWEMVSFLQTLNIQYCQKGNFFRPVTLLIIIMA